MKKIFLIACIILYSFAASACEICGCGVGNYYVGLLPQFHRSFLGVRYQFSSFHTSIKNDPTQYSNDLFQTIQVWGGVNIGQRWQVLAIIPFNTVHQASDDGTYNANGIGDIALTANYKVLNHTSYTASKKLVTQQLWLGAGIKLGTGNFSIDPSDEALVALANTQLGSGSTDFMLNGIYNININKFGVSTGANYKINTANNDQYFFGNKFSASSIAYYTLAKTKTTFTPNIGLMYEHADANKLASQKIADTGGYLLSGAAGLEVSINKFTIGCNLQVPISQNFASGQTTTKLKGMFHIAISI